jgi:hypothetical protein
MTGVAVWALDVAVVQESLAARADDGLGWAHAPPGVAAFNLEGEPTDRAALVFFGVVAEHPQRSYAASGGSSKRANYLEGWTQEKPHYPVPRVGDSAAADWQDPICAAAPRTLILLRTCPRACRSALQET